MRICSHCTVCCTDTRVPELDKPERVPCKRLTEFGCSIYDERPDSCRQFACVWLQGELQEKDRPDLIGVMVEYYPKFRFAMCNDDQWKRLPIDKYMQRGIPIVVGTKTNKHIILPEGISKEKVISSITEELNGCS